ncbi:MAG: hypothetical protein AUK54_01310 [Helicobacteraceae bacterium CG2_30_36_10]|nr:MAG: hypothetical protein AUK54_01310 [Helicobacteraceae bacterium CG2_30_36_10]
MKYRIILFLILGVDAFVLFLQTSELSISYDEATLLYGEFSFLQLVVKASLSIFGTNDFALRVPMITLHISSAILLYIVSKKYIQREENRLWLILVFVLLPGVISSALLVDGAGLVIFGLLLFVYIYENYSKKYHYMWLALLTLLDGGFMYLFFSLTVFALYTKQKYFFLFNIVLFSISMYLYGINTEGLPKGHFLDSIGMNAAIFTPIIFIYLSYVLYKRYLTNQIDIVWFISSLTLIVSLVLSFRQRIHIENFAPYLILALPLGAQTFYSSYRVRLKMFRTKYKLIFIISLVFLFINSFVVICNKELYLLLDNPKTHFAYKMHIAKELATQLRKRKIYCVNSKGEMQKRLKFYAISECENNILIENSIKNIENSNVTISYKNVPIYNAYVTKINTQ